MRSEPNPFIPLTFKKNLFTVKQSLQIVLAPDEYAGVLGNTENNPETYQLKICLNDTESVCKDKYVSEIYPIAAKVGVDNPKQYGKNRKALCKAIQDTLTRQKRILPWATKGNPTILRAYIIAKKCRCRELIVAIDNVIAKLKKEQFSAFKQLFLDIISQQYPEQYQIHTDIIVGQVTQRLAKKIDKFPLFLVGILSQLYSRKRPTKFTEDIWNILLFLRKKIESTYATDFCKINQALYKLISKINGQT